MNEAQKRRRTRAIKVILTEFFMVLTVIALIVTLTLIVMGYKITGDGVLEQDGFLQIRTSPIGASVTIDGDKLMSRTNLSRAVSSGEHEVSFSKDGYDTWTKTILITPGLTYRLNYPRMFLTERKEEKILEFEDLDFVSISPKRELMIAASDQTREWQIINLDEDSPTVKKTIDLREVLPDISKEDFNRIKVVEWSKEKNKVLVAAEWMTKREWAIIDIDSVEYSKNLTTEFGMQFSDIKMENDTGEQLLVLENGNLRKLDITAAEVSRILLSKVENFYNFGPDVIYVGRDKDGVRHIGSYREGDRESATITTIEDGVVVKSATGEYYGDKYVAIIVNDNIKIYRGNVSSKKDKNIMLVNEDLEFIPNEVTVHGEGELIAAKNGKQYGVYDVETNKFTRYELENGEIKWINDYMFAFVDDESNLIIEDFDRGNRRSFAKKVANGFEISFTSDKWIYYINSKNNLVRQKVIE